MKNYEIYYLYKHETNRCVTDFWTEVLLARMLNISCNNVTLQCHYETLQCYNVTCHNAMLLCHNVMMLQCCDGKMLRCIVTMLRYNVTMRFVTHNQFVTFFMKYN